MHAGWAADTEERPRALPFANVSWRVRPSLGPSPSRLRPSSSRSWPSPALTGSSSTSSTAQRASPTCSACSWLPARTCRCSCASKAASASASGVPSTSAQMASWCRRSTAPSRLGGWLRWMRTQPAGERGIALFTPRHALRRRRPRWRGRPPCRPPLHRPDRVRARPSTRSKPSPPSDGVDVLFVGPTDLSHALGIPGRLDDPVFGAALARVGRAARAAGKAAGALLKVPEDVGRYAAEGFTLLGIASEAAILDRALRSTLDSARRARPAARPPEDHERLVHLPGLDRSRSRPRAADAVAAPASAFALSFVAGLVLPVTGRRPARESDADRLEWEWQLLEYRADSGGAAHARPGGHRRHRRPLRRDTIDDRGRLQHGRRPSSASRARRPIARSSPPADRDARLRPGGTGRRRCVLRGPAADRAHGRRRRLVRRRDATLPAVDPDFP